MLSVYVPNGTTLERIPLEPGMSPPEATVWIDLVSPTVQEDKIVETLLGIAVPTREEMQEIEVSSRLYVENGARYMTATLMCHSDTVTPKTTPVTFILAGHRLATVRYDEPRPFAIVEHKLARACPAKVTGDAVLMDLLDAIIDRSADILERIGAEVDQISHEIFEPEDAGPPSYNDILKALGRKGDLTSKVRESLVSIGRLLLFIANESESMKWSKDKRTQVQSMQRDVVSLTDHASYLTNKITCLLDARKSNMFFVPPGFAHGFVALEDNTTFLYKCTDYYQPSAEGGLMWNDPDLGIDWQITDPLISAKDQVQASFAGFESPF